MTAGAHVLGMIFMGCMLPPVLFLAKAYFSSLGAAFIVLGILFIPIFIVAHAVADVLDGLIENFLISGFIIIVLGIALNIFAGGYAAKIYSARVASAVAVCEKIQNLFIIASDQQEIKSFPSDINSWAQLALFCKFRNLTLEANEKDQGITLELYNKIGNSGIRGQGGFIFIFSVHKIPDTMEGKVLVVDSQKIEKLDSETAEDNYGFKYTSEVKSKNASKLFAGREIIPFSRRRLQCIKRNDLPVLQ